MKISELVNEGLWQGVKDYAARQGMFGRSAQRAQFGKDIKKEKEDLVKQGQADEEKQFIGDMQSKLKTAIAGGMISGV